MKKIKKQIRYHHSAEEGSVLLVALGIIVLLFVVIVGIFFFALDTHKKISIADRYTVLKDAESYALEESKTQLSEFLDKKIRKIINDVSNPSQDNLVKGKVNDMLRTVSEISDKGEISKPFFRSEAFGADKQYMFQVGLSPNTVVEAGPVYGSAEAGGWSPTAGTNQTAKRITIPIVVEVEERKDSQVIKHHASSHLVYEVQWEDIVSTKSGMASSAEIGKLDTWRNIFYNHYTNGENGLISADTWTRLLYRGYKYQAKKLKTFDGAGYDTVSQNGIFTFGGLNREALYDTKLSATSTAMSSVDPSEETTKSLTKWLNSKGSFIIEDIGLVGGLVNTDIHADNILAFTGSKKQDKTTFKDISGTANTGIFISRQNQTTLFKDSQINTPSLLITQTRKSINASDTGLMLDGTKLTTNHALNKFDYSGYLSPSGKENPQKHPKWSDMVKGGLVIAGSTVELKNSAEIKLGTGSNFILTNATIKEDTAGEESFSYQTTRNIKGNQAVSPNPPSVLKIDSNSIVTQDSTDLSFIDAPKKNRRVSSTESGTQQDQAAWLEASIATNTIEIASDGELCLGITGIEPFNLKLEKDGIFSFFAPTDPSFLDTTFLKKGRIKGKVIIYVRQGIFDVAKHLESGEVPVSKKNKRDDALNGEVTIIERDPGGNDGSRNVLRTFSYMVDVDFKKKK